MLWFMSLSSPRRQHWLVSGVMRRKTRAEHETGLTISCIAPDSLRNMYVGAVWRLNILVTSLAVAALVVGGIARRAASASAITPKISTAFLRIQRRLLPRALRIRRLTRRWRWLSCYASQRSKAWTSLQFSACCILCCKVSCFFSMNSCLRCICLYVLVDCSIVICLALVAKRYCHCGPSCFALVGLVPCVGAAAESDST